MWKTSHVLWLYDHFSLGGVLSDALDRLEALFLVLWGFCALDLLPWELNIDYATIDVLFFHFLGEELPSALGDVGVLGDHDALPHFISFIKLDFEKDHDLFEHVGEGNPHHDSKDIVLYERRHRRPDFLLSWLLVGIIRWAVLPSLLRGGIIIAIILTGIWPWRETIIVLFSLLLIT